MGKLFRLKEWLTVAEAARHLSTVFREEVSEADVLRLALDRRLNLSVNFVNHARARRGTVVPIDQAKRWELPGDAAAAIPGMTPGQKVMMLKGINIDNQRVLELEDEVVRLDGVYDLPMIGAEKLDIEHEYQRLTGGPEVRLMNLEGAFVQEDELTLFQLQESYDENEYQRGSLAHLRRLEETIASEKLSREEADRLLEKHAEDRRAFLERRKARPEREGYCPAAGLPPDAVLVVRTKSLLELQNRVETAGGAGDPAIGARAETTYLNIIGGLLQLFFERSPAGKPYSVLQDQSAVIDALLATQTGKPGIAKRTLEQKFAAAKRSLGSNH